MDQIRPWLFIGKYRETRDFPLLSSYGISAMLLLAELVEHDGISSCYLAVEDGEPLSEDLLQSGIDFVVTKKEHGDTILIACGAGISRSAAYAIAALKEIEGLSLVDAFELVKSAHPDSLPHPALWKSLCDYFNESVSWHEIA
jgi:protein-tyrosine phosphatase